VAPSGASPPHPFDPLYWAERRPDHPAWIFSDQVVSYGELASLAIRGSRALRELGLRTGDGIAVVSPNHPWSMAVYWAAQLAGLYYTPVSVQFLRDEVQHILGDCDATALIHHPSQADKIEGAPQRIRIDVEQWPDLLAAQPETLIADAAEGAEMLYSSGTTGRPKGVRGARPGAPRGSVSELFRRRVALHRVDPGAVYLSTAPLYHSAPLRYNAMMHRCGATSVIMPRFDAAASLALIERHRVSHSQWVPTMFVRLLRLPESMRGAHDLSSHRVAIHAAAPCPPQIKRQMIDWWGPILYEYYSGTEGNGQTALDSAEWLDHPGSVGRPVIGAVHIVDDAGEELPPGETGRVFFSGGPRFEYYNDPDKTP
jgi:long-chain acyl-CoA synthetase